MSNNATQWRTIAKLPGYEISEHGDVRRAGVSLTGTLTKAGYRIFQLTVAGRKVSTLAQRLVCEAWHGPPQPGAQAAHYDGNKLNNHYSNLRWATPSSNSADRMRHGTSRRTPLSEQIQAAISQERATPVKARPLPPQSVLHQTFDYEPGSGKLIRKGRKAPNRSNDARYNIVKIDGVPFAEHRIIWKFVTGEDPLVIDHINGNRSDNRWANLRNATVAQNARNAKRSSTNTSGCPGVRLHKRDRLWLARITVNYKEIFLGSFRKKSDAISTRRRAEAALGFHPNHGAIR